MAKLEIELHDYFAYVKKDGVLVGVFEADNPSWSPEKLEEEVTEWVKSGMK